MDAGVYSVICTSDLERTVEPGRIVGGGAVVVDEDMVVAAVAKDGAPALPDGGRRGQPA